MNAQSYTADIIEPHLLPYLHTLQQPLFQQDHAQSHIAKILYERPLFTKLTVPALVEFYLSDNDDSLCSSQNARCLFMIY